MIDREAESGGGPTDHRISRRAILLAVPAVAALATSARSGSIGFGHIPTEIVLPFSTELGVAPGHIVEFFVQVAASDLESGAIPLEYGVSDVIVEKLDRLAVAYDEAPIEAGANVTALHSAPVPQTSRAGQYFVITALPTGVYAGDVGLQRTISLLIR